MAKLKRLQQQLDPFELSRTIQAKLEHIFQLSQETAAVEKAASHPPLPQVSTDIHRKKKEAKKKEEKRRRRVTSYGRTIPGKVTFLNCLTGRRQEIVGPLAHIPKPSPACKYAKPANICPGKYYPLYPLTSIKSGGSK